MLFEALKLEYIKFRKSPVIAFLTLLFLLLTPLASLISNEVANLQKNLPFNMGDIMSFPYIWDWMGYMGSWLSFFFLGVIAIYIVCLEISYKTQRQGIINGQTRKEYYFSKLTFIIAIAIAATLYYIIWTLIFGLLHSEDLSFSSIISNNWAIPRYFLMTLSYMIFAFFLAIVFKRSGIVIFLYLSWVMAIESLVRWGFHKKIFGTDLINYYPMNAVEDLMPNPIYRLAEKLPDSDLGFELLSFNHAAIISFVSSLIMLYLSYRMFLKRDM